MENNQKALLGSWIQASGTVLSAIGSTPTNVISDDLLDDLNLLGNVLQATGNALIADTEKGVTLDKIGNIVQSIGNSTVITGLLINFDEETKQILNIQGNWLQALGGGVSFADAFGQEPSIDVLFNLYGNLLQTIGNSLQAISGVIDLKNKNGQKLNVIGSWVQAIGSILSFISQLKS
ncbi:hypothetical protein [Bacillus sp. FJAT-47783]|uniref:DUF6944 family repetitive protein n=1 Tax=Bacillus sp. FJAT-47783 TaxID=2922712 RepID=UPI001FAC39A1|nr:hypothetical protein [Bacillus sp. FJAT-47783]